MNTNFQKLYNNLNTRQKEAVDAIEGPVMVVAGPGTGKTQILTLRIANILLKTQVEPKNILALTFTNSGVSAMQKRLESIIGPAAYGVNIYTFHGFCQSLIDDNPDDFYHLGASRLATEVEQAEVLEKIIDSLGLKLLKPWGEKYFYLGAILSSIGILKREGVSAQKLLEIAEDAQKKLDAIPDKTHSKGAYKGKVKSIYLDEQKQIDKNRELAQVFTAYQTSLSEHKWFDYNDLIVQTYIMLEKNEGFRLRQMEKFQYILVDEHQDSNGAQNQMVTLLASFFEEPNLFVVGDEKQAIFRFQGASIQNFHNFTTLYPNAKLITLTQNYRSTQTILDSALALLKSDTLAANTKAENKAISIVPLVDSDSESYFVANEISQKIQAGVKPKEIAIIVRKNADIEPIARMLGALGVSSYAEASEDIFETEEIRAYITFLAAIEHFGEDAYLFKMLHTPFLGIHPLDLYKLSYEVKLMRRKLYDVVGKLDELTSLGLQEPQKIFALYEKLVEWKKTAEVIPLLPFLETIGKESGFINYLLGQPDSIEKVGSVRTFYSELARENEIKTWKLHGLFSYLERINAHNIKIKKQEPALERETAVHIMTAHKSKGLEFEYVYITGAYKGNWGGRRLGEKLKLLPEVFEQQKNTSHPEFISGIAKAGSDAESDVRSGINNTGSRVGARDDTNQNEKLQDTRYKIQADDDPEADERRLFFVAITRAKLEVILTYPKTKSDGRELLPSQFVAELNENLTKVIDATEFEEKLKNNPLLLVAPDILTISYFDKLQSFAKGAFDHFGLSVTALNNYLDCPWRYFFLNLVRVPIGQSKQLHFGNAIHEALSLFFTHFQNSGEKNKEVLLSGFENALSKKPLIQVDFDESRTKGLASLSAWFEDRKDQLNQNVIVRYKIPAVFLKDGSSQIKLTGELDLVEIVNAQNDAVVVDFKTGKPKSRNELLGQTKDADGNYFRQLTFYKLMLELQTGKHPNMVSGKIEFIEPDEKGNLHTESFEVQDDEVNALKTVITKVVSDITNFSFWQERCNKKDCEWCKLRENIKETL